jgi:hypothetical protein
MDREKVNAVKRRSIGRKAHVEWFNIFKILFPQAPLPHSYAAYADGDSNAAVRELNEFFEREAPDTLSRLLVNKLEDRIDLDEHRRIILDEAAEQASARFVSLLRPRINRLALPRPQRAEFEVFEHVEDTGPLPWGFTEAARSHSLAPENPSGINDSTLNLS